MSFYGIPDPDDMARVHEHAEEIRRIYDKYDLPILNADNMMLALRKVSFMRGTVFNDVIQQTCRDDDGVIINANIVKFWRLHVYTWCCAQALRKSGSLVECGVHMGLYSLTMMKTLNFSNFTADMYLYDTFEGLSEELSTEREVAQVDGTYDIPDWENTVRESFAPWPNAHIIKGRVPDVLHNTAPDEVSFLHLDMNAAEAEVRAFAFFQPRLRSGAIVLLDDYGRFENHEIGQAHKQLFDHLGYEILELPTGQGLVIVD
jgi:O-methyltransferase